VANSGLEFNNKRFHITDMTDLQKGTAWIVTK